MIFFTHESTGGHISEKHWSKESITSRSSFCRSEKTSATNFKKGWLGPILCDSRSLCRNLAVGTVPLCVFLRLSNPHSIYWLKCRSHFSSTPSHLSVRLAKKSIVVDLSYLNWLCMLQNTVKMNIFSPFIVQTTKSLYTNSWKLCSVSVLIYQYKDRKISGQSNISVYFP